MINKKIKTLAISSLLILGSVFYSCTKDNDVVTTEVKVEQKISNELLFDNSNELFDFSKIHSEGLSFTLVEFEKKMNENPDYFKNNDGVDEIKLFNFFEAKTHEFLKTKETNNLINSELLIFATEDMKINTYKNLGKLETLNGLSESAQKYGVLIEQSFDADASVLKKNLENIYLEFVNDENIPLNERPAVELMIGVAYDTYNFNGPYSPIVTRWKGIALSDLFGAGQWGALGAAAGPLGAIVVGINGAIINSAISHAISLW